MFDSECNISQNWEGLTQALIFSQFERFDFGCNISRIWEFISL
jgi:hypothetical protein